jgi:hypothetical protein
MIREPNLAIMVNLWATSDQYLKNPSNQNLKKFKAVIQKAEQVKLATVDLDVQDTDFELQDSEILFKSLIQAQGELRQLIEQYTNELKDYKEWAKSFHSSSKAKGK